MNVSRYPCLCCGHRTLAFPAGGTMEICPVCFWEDSGDFWSDNGQPHLADAQRHFLETGVSAEVYADVVRPPLAEEARSPHWLSIDEMRLKAISLIEEAYAGVTLNAGFAIFESGAPDNQASEGTWHKAGKKGCRWQDTSDEEILKLRTSLVHLDQKEIRFCIPAFMRSMLRTWRPGGVFRGDELFLCALESGPDSIGYHADAFDLLNEPQRQAIAVFLIFISKFDDWDYGAATKALANGWDAFVPEDLSRSFQ